MSVSLLNVWIPSTLGNTSEFTIIENTSKKQRIHFDTIVFAYVADATVANRYIRLKVYDAKGNCVANVASDVITASQNRIHNFSRSAGSSYVSGTSGAIYPLPKLWLEPFQKLKVLISGGVAGDWFETNISAFTEKVAFTL